MTARDDAILKARFWAVGGHIAFAMKTRLAPPAEPEPSMRTLERIAPSLLGILQDSTVDVQTKDGLALAILGSFTFLSAEGQETARKNMRAALEEPEA